VLMSRKKILVLSTSVVAVVGVAVIIGVFSMSMFPSDKAKANNYPGIRVSDLKVGEEKVEGFNNKPVLIIRKGEEDFVVWDLIPRFSSPSVVGCMIKHRTPEWGDVDFEFREVCRHVIYSKFGEVLEGSIPVALPMKTFKWKYENNFIYLEANT